MSLLPPGLRRVLLDLLLGFIRQTHHLIGHESDHLRILLELIGVVLVVLSSLLLVLNLNDVHSVLGPLGVRIG